MLLCTCRLQVAQELLRLYISSQSDAQVSYVPEILLASEAKGAGCGIGNGGAIGTTNLRLLRSALCAPAAGEWPREELSGKAREVLPLLGEGVPCDWHSRMEIDASGICPHVCAPAPLPINSQ